MADNKFQNNIVWVYLSLIIIVGIFVMSIVGYFIEWGTLGNKKDSGMVETIDEDNPQRTSA